MMYSFGTISASSAGQNMGNDVNKNEIEMINNNNSDFLVFSTKNNKIKLGLQKDGIVFAQIVWD